LGVTGDDYSAGKPLWPEVKTMGFLLERAKKDPAMFRALFMGNPRDLEGLIIKPDWIRIENDIKSLGTLILSCRGWDFGYTENGDQTVGARIDVYEKGEQITPILSSVVACRKDPTAVKQFVVETAQADGPDVIIGVESGGTQLAMSSDLMKHKALMNFRVRPVTPKGDKVARAMPWILKLEDGMFRLSPGPWNQIVKAEMVDFADGCDHDDIEDAITNAWKTLWGVAA
jgi:predicted phage terminase large subunit-like protein